MPDTAAVGAWAKNDRRTGTTTVSIPAYQKLGMNDVSKYEDLVKTVVVLPCRLGAGNVL